MSVYRSVRPSFRPSVTRVFDCEKTRVFDFDRRGGDEGRGEMGSVGCGGVGKGVTRGAADTFDVRPNQTC